MSGGTAFLLDADIDRINQDMVALEDLDADDAIWLHGVLTEHAEQTDSEVAAELLSDWEASLRRFCKVMPRDYRKVLDAIALARSEGRNVDEAIMEASRG
jgi:glutamate synthase (NADPH/NADH) large chain